MLYFVLYVFSYKYLVIFTMIIMEKTRHISAVDKIENLRTFVKQDLRDMGIKLPKSKKAKKLNNSRAFSQDGLLAASGIFGNFLAHVPCEYISGCGYVPKFLVDAAEHIKKNVDVEGIFRKSGALSRQKELKQQIEDGNDPDISNINDLTGLIKQFFRELPEPLFTSLYHDSFIKCYQLGDSDSVTKAILMLCLLLPAEHLSTLRFIMQLFAFIADHSDQNKMDPANLAVVMAPNIMHVNSKSEKMNSTEEKLLQIQTSIVELLVKNAEAIGMISESLYQRQALMTECFGTDDELDASGDNTLEESKDVKKKEKKRKRSGSFQGLVSSIAHGLAKLRRSTDGKNISSSQPSTAHNNESTQSLPTRLEHASGNMVTPVVIRKRKVSGEVPFSASKKKAILQHLPQQATLASTPFTPGTGRKKRDFNDPRKMGVLNTPSIAFGEKAQLPFTATPCQDMKSSRKKLNLFSPLSSKKLKRTPSGANISTQSAKKHSKGKNIFRRMSGGKADKVEDTNPVGERLASPKGTSEDDYGFFQINAQEVRSPKQQSPIDVISSNSPSLMTQDSTLLSRFDDTQMLNEGFIDANSLDVTANSSNPLTRSYSLYTNTRLSRADVPYGRKPHKRSLSADGTASDDKMQILRRGQPNTIKNGLLKGEQQQLKKLRKSFEKPDISGPIPIIVPPVQEYCGTINVFESKEAMLKAASNKTLNASVTNVILPPPNQFADESRATDYDSDESEAGFSTISGGTVIHVPVLSSSSLKSNASSKSCDSNMISASQQNLVSELHSSNSTDSLLSAISVDSTKSHQSNLKRCLSNDSGQGSLLDYTVAQMKPNPEQKEDTLDVAFIESESILMDRTIMLPLQRGPNISLSSGHISSNSHNYSFHHSVKKSSSANQLAPLSSNSVIRSQSMCMNTSRRHNIKPNILISADTHKILARAGFLANTSSADAVQDYRVPIKTPPKFSIADHSQNSSKLTDMSVQKTASQNMSDNTANQNLELEKARQTISASEMKSNTSHQEETEQNHQLKIKRAQILIPKHDSIANIQVNQAGKVAENVKQFMDSSSDDVSEKHRSPFRFPNSTSRRGVSPIRIPTIFAKNDKHGAQLRELALLAKEKSEALKRLQNLSRDSVSRAAFKPQTGQDMTNKQQSEILSCENVGGSSKEESIVTVPSVLENVHADDVFKYPGRQGIAEEKAALSPDKMKIPDSDRSGSTGLKESVTDSKGVAFGGVNVDLSSSLIATINDVCTPKSERLDRIPLIDCGNVEAVTPKLQLRTVNGMTPRHVIKFCQLTPREKCRSPGKPVKRLSSPRSPCSASKQKSRSPHRGPSSLSRSVQSHLQATIEEM